MALDLALTPSGRLTVYRLHAEGTGERGENGQANVGSALGGIVKGFGSSTAAGLFALATHRLDPTWTASFGYWRDFAAAYLARLCQNPEGTDTAVGEIPPPGGDELAPLLLRVPPMSGAEYVSPDRLESLWRDLDSWVRDQVATSRQGLAVFLRERAPLWHQVGRVCFHLAENRRDRSYPFAFLATYAPTVTSGGRVLYQPLSKALQQYSGSKNKNALIKLLAPVQAACQSSRLVRELVESGDIYQPLAWTARQAHRFLMDIPSLESSGILVRVPDWWKKRPRPMVSMTIGNSGPKRFDVGSLLDFQIEVALGDQPLSEEELRELVAGEDGLVLLRGQWVEVDREKLTQALEQWKRVEQQAGQGLSFIEGMRLLAGAPIDLSDGSRDKEADRQWSFVRAGDWLGQILTELRSPHNDVSTVPGEDLRATLRNYQQTGVNWLCFLSELGLGGCLADDMGLGKTIQVLATLLVLKRRARVRHPSLLVLPASLLANWKAELVRFAPTLRFRFVHPSQTARQELEEMARDPERARQNVDLVLTTYGTLIRQPWLCEQHWQLVVLDEAQAIKNPAARQTRAVKRLTAQCRIALTGTPIENRLSDLWSLFDFLCPGLLGSRQKFSAFVKSLETSQQDRFAPLRRLVGPYILRRLKTDKTVIADLPDKSEVRAYCGLTKRQAGLYAKLVRELADALQGLDGIKRRGLVLAYLLRFKQLCNHPSQLLGDGGFRADESGKFMRLEEICEEIASRQEKALVFTQFREMTEPLSEFLSRVFQRPGCQLHGGTPVKSRQSLIDQFQSEDGPPFFVLSLKAGGTGLNLTAASHVIHFDRWWNPAVENQATDRAFRIGQRRNVMVHKFVCQGTIEERIDALIEQKKELSGDVLEGGGAETLLTEMSDSELIRFVSLDVDRVTI